MKKLKIVVYAITKNEEKFVDRWVDSMSEADEIYVLDTGSIDKTVKLLKKRGVNVLVKKFKNERALGMISVVGPILGLIYYGLGGGYLPWNIDVCVMALPFFYAGYFMKNHAVRIEGALNTKWKKGALFVSMLALNLVFGSLSVDDSLTGLEMFYSKYGSNPIFTYIAAFAGIVCMVIVAKAFSCRAICYLGENTMLYYAWHQTIMMPVVENLMRMCGLTRLVEKGTMWYNLVWLLGILLITTVLIWIMKKLGLKFMLGK